MKQRNHNHKETRARARKGRAGAHAAQDKAATGKATTPPATHDRDRRAELTVKATSNGNAQPIEGDTVTADGPTAEQPAPPDERREQQAEQPAAAKKTAKQRPKRRRKQRMPKRRAPAAPAKPKPTLNHEATDDPAATTRPEVGSSHGSGANDAPPSPEPQKPEAPPPSPPPDKPDQPQPTNGNGGEQHHAGDGGNDTTNGGGNGHAAVGRVMVRQKAKPDQGKRKRAEDYTREQTEQLNAVFKWADELLKKLGLLDYLKHATTREELDAISLDDDDPKLILAIRDALHPGSGKQRDKHFASLNESQLKAILRNRLASHKKDELEKLQERDEQHGAAEQEREKREENVKFYGEFKQYKALDHGGVFVELTEEQPSAFGRVTVTNWVQIAKTRIDLMAVTRSRQDDNWGVYVKIINMDGRPTKLAIPRSVINDKQGTIAGRLADLGVDAVRERRELLPDFLLTTVEITEGDRVQDLMRFLAVPTTGWCQLGNGRWVFVLPHATKMPADLAGDETAIFQTEHLHLTHGFAIEGTVEEWCEQIATPFARNSNVILAVGVALSGPLTVWAGVPPGLFHIFCPAKRAKSLCSAIGQSIYGRPLVPNETIADPFGISWLATANSIGQLILVRSSISAFFEELNQGKAQDIADVAYRVANGIDKMRLRGGNIEPRLTYCVPGFSTGEEPMVDFLTRVGQRVTDGMRTRFADIPAEVRRGSVFETFDADAIRGLGEKFYRLLGRLHGAVGDAWLQVLVDLGHEEITARVSHHQQAFRSRPGVQATYALAGPHQRSVMDRFATVAAALQMAIEVGLLPWDIEDTDAGIESCLVRWADHDKLNPVVIAILRFMEERQREPWEGTASQLLNELSRLSNGVVESPESLGRWLKKSENLQRLAGAGIKIAEGRAKTRERTKLIRIEKVVVA